MGMCGFIGARLMAVGKWRWIGGIDVERGRGSATLDMSVRCVELKAMHTRVYVGFFSFSGTLTTGCGRC